MKITIDRFEEDKAVVEIANRQILILPKKLFEDAKEGDVFTIEKDDEKTSSAKNRIQNKLNNLFG